MARKIELELGESEYTEYGVYNRNTQELVFKHGVCWAGMPQVWFKDYSQAERLLNTALEYYPDDHILTIVKKDVKQTIIDTMPPRS